MAKSFVALHNDYVAQPSAYVMRQKLFVAKSVTSYYALIKQTTGPYKEIFVLTFKACEQNVVRSMHLECQNKYFSYEPKSRLIRALLNTYTNKIVYDEILLN